MQNQDIRCFLIHSWYWSHKEVDFVETFLIAYLWYDFLVLLLVKIKDLRRQHFMSENFQVMIWMITEALRSSNEAAEMGAF